MLWLSSHHKRYPLLPWPSQLSSSLYSCQSTLTNPSSGPLLRSQGRIFHSGSPGEKARLISKEGSICQSANPSIVYTEFDKAANCLKELQFPVIYTKILELTLNIHSSNNLIYNSTTKYTTKTTTV